MFPEIDWFSSSGFQSIFIKSYELLPGREGVDVLVLRHVHVEPPGAGHDVLLDWTLQRGGNILSGGSLTRDLTRDLARDPEMFLMKLESSLPSCQYSQCVQARQGKGKFQNTKPIH